MKLYYHPLSGHAHRAHLFLSLAGLPHELKPVDLAASEQKTAKFLELNAFGEIPVLEDGGITIRIPMPSLCMRHGKSVRLIGCRRTP